MKQFDFGENWKNFSEKALTPDRVAEAEKDFKNLVNPIDFKDKTFVDIGFGQGLSLLIATKLGAKTHGLDINPKCAEVINYNKQKFPTLKHTDIPIVVGSVLEQDNVTRLRSYTEQFDIVHSWGVLHHTGKMWEAIDKTTTLVKESGYLVLAIYNRHWTSSIWLAIKYIYMNSPKFIQKLMVHFFAFLTAIRLRLSGESTSSVTERGMDYYYDVIDWVGGYPYEYASKEEIEKFLNQRGFTLEKYIPTFGFTGCNQFVFKKTR